MKKVITHIIMLIIAIVSAHSGIIMVEELVDHSLYDSLNYGWVYTFNIAFVTLSTSFVWASIIAWGVDELTSFIKDLKRSSID